MANDKQETIFASKDAKDFSDKGGKNSNDADLIKLEGKIDINKLKNRGKYCRKTSWLSTHSHSDIFQNFKVCFHL